MKRYLNFFQVLYALLLSPLLFFLEHMACHVFTYKILEWNKHFPYIIFLECVHSFWSHAPKHYKKNFYGPSRNRVEKEKKTKKKGNCKGFCVTDKAKKGKEIAKLSGLQEKVINFLEWVKVTWLQVCSCLGKAKCSEVVFISKSFSHKESQVFADFEVARHE